MGSNDIPPPHVPAFFMPVSNALLQVGGSLWTLCYILLVHQSLKDRTYGMPLFSTAFNVAWEIIYGLYVAEMPLERIVFTAWLILDVGIVYGLLAHGKDEWNHAPLVKRNLGKIFLLMVVWCTLAHYAFAKWWIDNEMGKREGKIYGGIVGPDTTELGFWSAVANQIYLSVTSLIQLLVRRHTGGVSWSIWASRTMGSFLGLYLNYAWMLYYWPEAHKYFLNPFAILLWSTALVADLVYPFVFAHFRRTETVSKDGKKIAGNEVLVNGKKKKGS